MQLEILTPEHRIFEHTVDAVQVPGANGLFQILDGHAPLISTLQPGTVKIDLPTDSKKLESLHGSLERDKSDDRLLRLPIDGGVVEVTKERVIILAD